MDFSYLLNKGAFVNTKLLEYGFDQKENEFVLTKDIPGFDFYSVVSISNKSINVEVFEKDSDEKYYLFDVSIACGSFVGEVRNKISDLMNDVFEKCFESEDIKEKYVKFIKDEFSVDGEHPWNDSAAVFRSENGKWFALLMRPTFKKLGINSDEPVWCVNLKHDADEIPDLIDNKTIFPAWHMTKKHWMTVILTSVTDFELLCDLTRRSFELVK